MYKKKSKLPIIAAILALIVLVGITIGSSILPGICAPGNRKQSAHGNRASGGKRQRNGSKPA